MRDTFFSRPSASSARSTDEEKEEEDGGEEEGGAEQQQDEGGLLVGGWGEVGWAARLGRGQGCEGWSKVGRGGEGG